MDINKERMMQCTIDCLRRDVEELKKSVSAEMETNKKLYEKLRDYERALKMIKEIAKDADNDIKKAILDELSVLTVYG